MTAPTTPAVTRRELIRLAAVGPLVPSIPAEERSALERAAHAGGSRAVRAAVVLAGNEPIPAPRIAARLGVSQLTVLRWVWRYRRRGLADLLNPLP